jgi:hypothetical protein
MQPVNVTAGRISQVPTGLAAPNQMTASRRCADRRKLRLEPKYSSKLGEIF